MMGHICMQGNYLLSIHYTERQRGFCEKCGEGKRETFPICHNVIIV